MLLRLELLDRFTGDDAVAMRAPGDDIDVRSALQRLRRANLIINDRSGAGYRLTAPVRVSLDRTRARRLDSDAERSLRRTAAGVLAGRDGIAAAIAHLVAAGDDADAVNFVVDRLDAAFDADRWERVAEWIAALPADAAASSLAILVARCWVGAYESRADQLAGYRTVAEAALADPMLDPEVAAHWRMQLQIAYLSLISMVERDPVAALETLDDFFARADQFPHWIQGQAIPLRAYALSCVGRSDEAVTWLAGLLEEAGQEPLVILAGIHAGGALVRHARGDVGQFGEASERLIAVARRGRLRYWLVAGLVFAGTTAWERNDLPGAVRAIAQLRSVGTPAMLRAEIIGLMLLDLLYDHLGRPDEADAIHRRLAELLETSKMPWREEYLRSARLQREIRRTGWSDDLQDWLRDVPSVPIDQHGVAIRNNPTWMRILFLLCVGTPEAVDEAMLLLDALDALDAHWRQLHLPVMANEGLVFRAWGAVRRGQATEAQDLLRAALRGAQQYDTFRAVADLARPLQHVLVRIATSNGDELPLAEHVIAMQGEVVEIAPYHSQRKPRSEARR